MKAQSIILAIALERVSVVCAANSTDDWVTVDQTELYRSLEPCARSCVRDANQRIWDVEQGMFCRSYGCVCSESTTGDNYLNGQSNVTSCARDSCSTPEAVASATATFGDLCLVQALNESRPTLDSGQVMIITAAGYPDLTDCARFVLNGCMDENGVRNEPDCEPIKRPPDWEDYRGAAEQRDCTSPECLCRGPNFDVTFAVAYDAATKFCAMRPSTQALPNPQLDDMMNVLAMDCASYGYPPRNYTYSYSGLPPGSDDGTGDMSMADRVQIGLSSAAVAVALGAVFITYKMTVWTMAATQSTDPTDTADTSEMTDTAGAKRG